MTRKTNSKKLKAKTATKAKLAPTVQPLTKPSSRLKKTFPVLEDFFGYDWRSVPPRHAFGVYALCLYANLPDYREIAAESLTEGSDDKDCDLCFIDTEAGAVFIVQAQIVGQPLPDLFAWKVAPSYFNDKWRSAIVSRCKPLVESLVPIIVSQIEGEAKDVVRSTQDLEKIAKKVGFQILSLQTSYESVMSPIRDVSSV